MKKVLLAVLFCLAIGLAFGQTNGDYRSRTSGNWGQVATWDVYNDGWQLLSGTGAGPYRNVIPSVSSGNIEIYHQVVLNVNSSMNEMIIHSGGHFRIAAGRTAQFIGGVAEAPLQINVNGSLTNNGILDLSSLSALPCTIDGFLASN